MYLQVGERAATPFVERIVTTWYVTTTRTTHGLKGETLEAAQTAGAVADEKAEAEGSQGSTEATRVPYAPTRWPASFAVATTAASGSDGGRSVTGAGMGTMCTFLMAVVAAVAVMVL